MARTTFASVADYIAAQPPAARKALYRVRSAIRRAVPRGRDVISYQIPARALPAGRVLYYAAWKSHYSIYPATRTLVVAFAKALAPYEVRKGTIRFPLDAPVPEKLIERLAKFRAREVTARSSS